MATVLILDSDPWTRTETQRLCASLGHEARAAVDLGAARREALDRQVDVVLADLDAGAWDLLEELEAHTEPPQVVLTSRTVNVATAVDALRRGARDLLRTPIDPGELGPALARLAPPSVRGTEEQIGAARNSAGAPGRWNLGEDPASSTQEPENAGPIVGRSEPLLRTLDLVSRVSRTDRSTVLVLGESGSGKELIARAVHDRSERSDGPFVAVNCAALTDSLLEAELFGYEPGAFTGAARGGRTGLLAAASGGTLLLDEIGELAPALQAKLLRVLQERTYRRVGGSEDLEFDARIIACTHRDLVGMVRDGQFREDFFYRLNVLSIHVPPLREREGDLPLLTDRFLAEMSVEFGGPPLGLTPAAMEALSQRRWPGNVRELRNTLERAALLSTDGTIRPEHLGGETLEEPGLRPQPPRSEGLGLSSLPLEDCSLRRVEEAVIRHVIDESEGNRSRAARVLGVNRSTLYSKLKAYSID